MSKKLSIEEQGLSESAVNSFKQMIRPDFRFKTKVEVFEKDGNEIIYSGLINVHQIDEYGWFEIIIEWEDSHVTYNGYRRMGLYGGYSTNFIKMEFIESTKKLKIYPNDSDLIILIDSK
ncbi:hypothetical protein [Clostridium gasigenes]|uniref:Uncharacterized protein n=1 Tax=Clostridium gasigenes TaxID=94869 RepID=A0A7X0VU99_9CLOT|nr:hypothetical protein [Clostridium gasigenes]MBB6716281.1 hypothetical protein [Clostridium gasigenes]